MCKIIDILFPMIPNYRVNKIIREKINPKNEKGEDLEPIGILSEVKNANKLNLEVIKEQYNDTFRVKESLEDKAKTNVIGVTISITLIMGASEVLSALNKKYPCPILSWILSVLIVVSVLYMVIAGILAISLLTNENEVYVVDLNSLASDEVKQRNDYDKRIFQNQNKNIIRNNNIFTSYECIRNSLACLFIILILIVLPVNSTSKKADETLTYSTQPYSFMYSSSAVDHIKENEARVAVENLIVDTIESIETNDHSKAFGIVDDENNLFIKFNINGESVEILLVEPYMAKPTECH